MPNLTDKASYYFYQGGTVSAVSEGEIFYTIFRSKHLPLATVQGDVNADLLMVEEKHSVLTGTLKKSTHGYSAYGYKSDTDTSANLLGFNGELRLDNRRYSLGNGYRTYDPALMRFHAPDSESPFESGGINAYAYCLGDPVNLADPSGHNPLRVPTLPPKHNFTAVRTSVPPQRIMVTKTQSAMLGRAYAEAERKALGLPAVKAVNSKIPNSAPPRNARLTDNQLLNDRSTITGRRGPSTSARSDNRSQNHVKEIFPKVSSRSAEQPQALISTTFELSDYSSWSQFANRNNSGILSYNMKASLSILVWAGLATGLGFGIDAIVKAARQG